MATKPSDLHKPETFARIPVLALQRYLIARGWQRVFVEEDRNIAWFYHDHLPVIQKCYRMSTRPLGYMSAHMVPREINVPDTRWVVKTIPQHFVDYVPAVFDLLEDLERHEDRWQGHIIDDVMLFADDEPAAADANGSTDKRIAPKMRYVAQPLNDQEFAEIRDSWWTKTGGDIKAARLVATVVADQERMRELRNELEFVTERLMENADGRST